MNRKIALTLLTTLTAVPALGMTGTAGAADPLCASEHAAENVTFTVADGVANLTATARPGCEGVTFGLAAYSTAHLSFDPAEVQPLIVHTSVETVLGSAPVTVPLAVPGSTVDGQCRVQIDAVVGGFLTEINPLSRYNEAAIGHDSNADGLVTNRLIGARYVDQACVEVEEPPVVTTPAPPTPVVDGPQVELDAPPPVVVVATPTPAPEPPAVALSDTPIVALTSEQMEMLPVTGSARLLPMIALGLGMVGAGLGFQVAAARRNRNAGK